MAKEHFFEISYVETAWYNSSTVKLSDKEYNKAIEEDNLDEVLHDLYWDDPYGPEVIQTTKPEYLIEKIDNVEKIKKLKEELSDFYDEDE